MEKKRPRDDDLYQVEDVKQGRVNAADVGYNNLSELSPDCYYYYCVLDAECGRWGSDDGRGSGIRGMAIRKQSYMQDCFNGGDKKSEAEDLVGVGLDGGDVMKELWRAESPLCEGATQEPLFGDCYLGLEDESASASGFRFWEEDDDQKNQTMRGEDVDEYEGAEELFSESVELEVCAPSL